MTSQEKKWKYKNEEEEKLAKYLIGLEEDALKKYFKGDSLVIKNFGPKLIFLILMLITTKELMNINKFVIGSIKL